ncbi:hypothetical protein [Modestobacter sp. SYSU DS0290]
MRRPTTLLAGSPREQWALAGLVVLLVVAAPLAALRGDGVLTALVTAAPAGLGLLVAYAAVLTADRARHDDGGTARAALDATAPVVSVRVADVLASRGGGDVRFEVLLEVENHGSTPVVVEPGRASRGRFREARPLALAPRRGGAHPGPHVRCLTLQLVVPAPEVAAGLAACTGRRFGWTGVTVVLLVHNLGRTVTDELRLAFDLEPFTRGSDGGWVWTDAPLTDDGGWGWLAGRSYRDLPQPA